MDKAGAFFDETWFLWRDRAHPPGLNMAIDELLLQTSSEHGAPVLRFYQWDRNAISIGYMQSYKKTQVPGYELVRRPTGGGVVYHDHDFTYSVALPPKHKINNFERTQSYNLINGAVACGLRRLGFNVQTAMDMIANGIDRAAMVCFKQPTRYDILCDGRKISGSAQRRSPDGLLHQGSIHFNRRLPVSRNELAEALRAGFNESLNIEFAEFANSQIIQKKAIVLARAKYELTEWNQRR